MRRHLFSLGWELKLSYMSSILLSSLLFFFRLWQETNMAHALRHLDKVTIELFTHGPFHFKRKSMSILQDLMTPTIHRNSQTFLWRRFIWLELSPLFIPVTVVNLVHYNISSLIVLFLYYFLPFAIFVSTSFPEVQIFIDFNVQSPRLCYDTQKMQHYYEVSVGYTGYWHCVLSQEELGKRKSEQPVSEFRDANEILSFLNR